MFRVRFWLLVVTLFSIAAALLIFGMPGGSQARDITKVDLRAKSQIPPVQQIENDDFTAPNPNTLRVAIAGVLSPAKTLEFYQELLTYLGQRLDRRVKLFLKPTYAEINDLIRRGQVDVAFVCSLAYVRGKDDFGLELLAAPQINGETVYYSYLIVPVESNAIDLRGLRGRSFAFTDPLSNSGFLAPTYQLSRLGETAESFLGRHIFTYSHDNSIAAVASKLIDAAAVDSLVYDQLLLDEPDLASKVKVIASWGPYGIPPVVVNPALDAQLKQKLQAFFRELPDSPEGKALLNNLRIDRFVVVPDRAYDTIREMKPKSGW